jgi:putative tricarboxylic transport membrane protein
MNVNALISGLQQGLTDPMAIVMTLIGTLMGLIFGSLPGLTAAMGVALLVPITYSFSPIVAFGMMLGCYVGGTSGGAISACLLNIPGTPSAICTTFDGHPMTKQGRGAKALGWAAMASAIGGIISWLVLVFLSPALASLCTRFTSSEYTCIALFGLIIIAAMSEKSLLKGVMAGAVGVFISTIGVDAIFGSYRFTFSSLNLMGGVPLIPAVIGIFSIPQIISLCVHTRKNPKVSLKLKDFVPGPREIWAHKLNIVRSSIIGTIVGIIPDIGGQTAAFFAYDQARRSKSPDPHAFGEGNVDGVIAPETANNAVCGGALVPMLTLGIPGDPVTAILMGGLMIQGLRPGPALFLEHFDIMVGIFSTLLLATVFMLLLQLIGIKFFCKILGVPTHYLAPILGVLAMVGSFAIRNNPFDMIVALIFGFVGYFMEKGEFNTAPMVLGLVMGYMFETELRLTLQAVKNDWTIFVTRPISLGILIVVVLVLGITTYRAITKNKRKPSAMDIEM